MWNNIPFGGMAAIDHHTCDILYPCSFQTRHNARKTPKIAKFNIKYSESWNKCEITYHFESFHHPTCAIPYLYIVGCHCRGGVVGVWWYDRCLVDVAMAVTDRARYGCVMGDCNVTMSPVSGSGRGFGLWKFKAQAAGPSKPFQRLGLGPAS